MSNDSSEKSQCASEYPIPYYFGTEARYEGSGGASGLEDAQYGGSGGGIIWISATDTVTLFATNVTAEGEDGLRPSFNSVGSGGGAGGSI